MKQPVPHLIEGGSFTDERGSLRFVNDFDLGNIRRFYIINHDSQAGPRAWQGHKKESKYFFCLKGAFTVFLVRPDDWENPSKNLKPASFTLSAEKNQVLEIPGGYINGFIATSEHSSLLVFSDKTLEESKSDDYRFNSHLWVNWNDYD